MSAVALTDKDFAGKLEKGLSLVDFWAPWCGPCSLASPIIDELADSFKDKVLVAKVNVDEFGDLAGKYQVMSIPTVVVFKDGKEIDRAIGFIGKDGYQQLIEKYLK